jgi:hypothetical protein
MISRLSESSRRRGVATVIGTPAFLLEFVFAISGVAFAVGVAWAWMHKRVRPRWELLALGLMGLAMSASWVVHSFHIVQLWRLSAPAVTTVRVGRISITERTHVEALVSCLRSAEWFVYQHGGSAKPVALVLERRDARPLALMARRYLRAHGIVVEFEQTGLYGGAAFSSCLPEVLKEFEARSPGQGPRT